MLIIRAIPFFILEQELKKEIVVATMRRIIRGILIGALISLLISVPVLAGYYAYIYVTESLGTDYENLALNYSMDISYLVDSGYISSTGMDTRVTDSDLLVLPHMLAEDRLLWVGNITGSATTEFMFFTGQSALNSTPIITGHGGYVTVPDNATLEPGDVFAFGIVGYIDTAAGADKNIIRKDGALVFNVTAEGELTFAITGGNSLVATGVPSGVVTVMVFSDGYELWMEIDDVVQDVAEACTIPDTDNDWYLFENDVMPYVYYYAMWTATT